VLTEFEVPVFHAMDFFAWRTDSNGEIVRESPYQGWTEADDFEFIDSLLRTTEDAGLFKAGTAINLSQWLELTEDERRYLWFLRRVHSGAHFGKQRRSSYLYRITWRECDGLDRMWLLSKEPALVIITRITSGRRRFRG
jgi:hypothetical protein